MSELTIILKAKDLSEYIFQITDKAPKKFRFTLTSRMQDYSMDLIEQLYRANRENALRQDKEESRRFLYQKEALASLDLLIAISDIAKKQQCIQAKHYYQICQRAAEIKRLLYAWRKSDISRQKEHQA